MRRPRFSFALLLAVTSCNALLGNNAGDLVSDVGDATGGPASAGSDGSGGASTGGSDASGGSVTGTGGTAADPGDRGGGGGRSDDEADASFHDAEADAVSNDGIIDDAATRDALIVADASDVAARDGSLDVRADVSPADARPLDPAAVLDGQRWDLPCGEIFGENELCRDYPTGTMVCPPSPGSRTVNRTLTFGGSSGTVYDVELRFRGVVEPKIYEGGMEYGQHLYAGGAPTPSQYEVYSLTVSSPAQTYYLNFDEHGGESHYVFPIDIRQVVPIAAGAKVTLESFDLDCALVRNCMDVKVQPCKPYVVVGVPPSTGYNGQFIVMNVLSVRER